MKPCRQFKELIALSIAEGRTDAGIEEHLAQCAACRTYGEEIRSVCSDHVHRAAHLPQSDAPVRLHGKIRASLQGNNRRWTWARPVAAGAVAALAIVLYLHWRPSPKPPPMVVTPSPPRQLTEPSYAAYRHQLSRSAEDLEAALSRHDTGLGAADELFTVSTRAGAIQ